MPLYKITTIFFLFIILFLGCKPAVNKLIINWEFQVNQCEIDEITELSDFKLWTAQDSIEPLNEAYEMLYHEKLMAVAQQVKEKRNEWEKAKKEFSTLTNPLMKKAYQLGLTKIEINLNQLKKVDSIYRNHPDQTFLFELQKQIQFYENNPHKHLGYVIEAKFTGVEGDLPKLTYQKCYFLDSTKSQVVSSWTKNESIFQ